MGTACDVYTWGYFGTGDNLYPNLFPGSHRKPDLQYGSRHPAGCGGFQETVIFPDCLLPDEYCAGYCICHRTAYGCGWSRTGDHSVAGTQCGTGIVGADADEGYASSGTEKDPFWWKNVPQDHPDRTSGGIAVGDVYIVQYSDPVQRECIGNGYGSGMDSIQQDRQPVLDDRQCFRYLNYNLCRTELRCGENGSCTQGSPYLYGDYSRGNRTVVRDPL